MQRILIFAACLIAAIALGSRQPATGTSGTSLRHSPAAHSRPDKPFLAWDPKSAASYLDQRASWWFAWPRAQRDHDTFCISCHTAVPYAMSRSALRGELAEQSPSPNERRLLDNVTRRVRLWRQVAPFYSDADRGAYKSVESRGTESVLNALVLASYDATTGHLSDHTRAAFVNMWAEQQTSVPDLERGNSSASPQPASYDQQGAWRWLRFKNEPWEADDSDFYGAALAAIATGIAPENYRARPEIQPNLKLLREYLTRQSSAQPLMNRVVLLWASAKLPGLLAPAQQKSILTEVLARQKPDGGWGLPALAGNWKRHDDTPQDPQSDGYATGLIAFVLQQFAAYRDPAQPPSRFDGAALANSQPKPALPVDVSSPLNAALAWLASHQNPSTGSWPSASLNNNPAHHISPDTVLFMNDAATSYAILALTASSTH